MTFIKCVSSAIRILCIALLMQSASSNQNGLSRPLNISHLSIETTTEGDDFVTRSVRNFEDCTQACARTTSCKFVNYRARGHVCLSTHYIGEGCVTITDDMRPGFVSWRNIPSNTASGDNRGICPECTTAQSCERDEALGTCTIVACGRPREKGTRGILGNRYRVGSKLAYKCSEPAKIGHTLQTITCSESGQWDDGHVVCGYTFYRLSDGTRLMLKAFDEQVDKKTAMERCGPDGASLVTVLSMEKLNVLRMLLDTQLKSGQYWVDTERARGEYWRTSDGRKQPMDDGMWVEYLQNDRFDMCARLRYKYGWVLDDISCRIEFGYICEIESD